MESRIVKHSEVRRVHSDSCNDNEELVTTVAFKEKIVYKGKTFLGEDVAAAFTAKAGQKHSCML